MYIFGSQNFYPLKDGSLFSDIETPTLDPRYKNSVLAHANDALMQEIELLPASLYMEFSRIGDRKRFEDKYHKRRSCLYDLLFGALYEGGEKYIGKMADIIWAICEETTWVVPAHSVSKGYVYHGTPLPDSFDDIMEVDLFSAATGALLALVYHFFSSELADISAGVIPSRMEYEIERRIFVPFGKRELRWTYVYINNWVSWIISNILTCAQVFMRDEQRKLSLVSRSAIYLDRLVGTYGNDGGCNEGASYWAAAIGPVFDSCELIYDMTGGRIDVFSCDFLQKACVFAADMCIAPEKKYFVNFADCAPIITMDHAMLKRMGRRLHSELLISLGNSLAVKDDCGNYQIKGNYYFPYRGIKGLFCAPEQDCDSFSGRDAVYPELQVCVRRRGNFTLAVKGGHNGESHNHNDVGSFILYVDKKPVIIDVGNLEYTKDTFNENRYKIWTNRSLYHNLPSFGEWEQKNGRSYRAERFEVGDSVIIEYADAYPKDAAVTICRREIAITDESVVVRDEAHSENGETTYHFMTYCMPDIRSNIVYLGNARIEFSTDNITYETISLESSQKMKNEWGCEKLYRLSVKAERLETAVFCNNL